MNRLSYDWLFVISAFSEKLPLRSGSSRLESPHYVTSLASLFLRSSSRTHPLAPAVLVLAVPTLVMGVAVPADASPIVRHETAGTVAPKPEQQRGALLQTHAMPAAIERDPFGATSAAEMEATISAASYVGPSVAELLANPPYPSFSLDQVAQVALQYQGVPYSFGGADPSGFDCSGLVLYVYAQFGISLPHSVSGQAASGTAITRDAALPGDIVIMTDGSHNGIYMGNGTFIDAPSEGRSVVVRPIYTDDYFIVRVGI